MQIHPLSASLISFSPTHTHIHTRGHACVHTASGFRRTGDNGCERGATRDNTLNTHRIPETHTAIWSILRLHLLENKSVKNKPKVEQPVLDVFLSLWWSISQHDWLILKPAPAWRLPHTSTDLVGTCVSILVRLFSACLFFFNENFSNFLSNKRWKTSLIYLQICPVCDKFTLRISSHVKKDDES